jgi:transposase
MKESNKKKVKDLEQKVKDLEQIAGSKQIMIDYLEKMMEIAKDDLGIDIKKNFNTSQSASSGKTKKK